MELGDHSFVQSEGDAEDTTEDHPGHNFQETEVLRICEEEPDDEGDHNRDYEGHQSVEPQVFVLVDGEDIRQPERADDSELE